MIHDVAIIVLAHNGAQFTSRCLKSLLECGDLPSELFLVDNGSTDNTPELIEEFSPRFSSAGVDVQTWRNQENLGCSRARNDAWKKVNAKFTVLLDNDTAVCTKNWLGRMTGTFTKHERLGLLGPKLIYPYVPHKIQCAGVSISPRGRIAFRGRGSDRNDPRYSEFKETKALISACWMMVTELREEVGFLDELFHPVQYEDLDLCLRAFRKGWTVAYTPEVEIYHFEGITTASFGQDEYRKNIARNSLKFRERHHELFATFEDELPAEEYRWLTQDELGLAPELDLAYSDETGY